jgi:hypothetical protein
MHTIRFLAGLMVLVLWSNLLPAEVPPLSEGALKGRATVIVTGTVEKVEAGKEKSRPDGSQTDYRLTVKVRKVEKGDLGKDAGPVVAHGSRIKLKPGLVGSTGHRSANSDNHIADVRKGWEVTLYLREPRDGAYEIVFPNGFKVLKKPAQEKGKR